MKTNPKKVTKSGENTSGAPHGYVDINGKKIEFSTIRSKFDGATAAAAKLPDGKEKNAILNAIEGTYLGVLSFLQGVAPVSMNA